MCVMRLILASASPARLRVLQGAGLHPEAIVSGVDESLLAAPTAPELVAKLAKAKAEAVFEGQPVDNIIVIGCDSVFEFEGQVYGKPESAAQARARIQTMRGHSGLLHTGHHVIIREGGKEKSASAVATTKVNFGDFDDAFIDAYLATGEPLAVAGAFTIDGYGGAFIDGVEGDPHNVIGISLPLLRQMLEALGLRYERLWALPTNQY
jgi:septum formation protein